jgi:hypothetical protein
MVHCQCLHLRCWSRNGGFGQCHAYFWRTLLVEYDASSHYQIFSLTGNSALLRQPKDAQRTIVPRWIQQHTGAGWRIVQHRLRVRVDVRFGHRDRTGWQLGAFQWHRIRGIHVLRLSPRRPCVHHIQGDGEAANRFRSVSATSRTIVEHRKGIWLTSRAVQTLSSSPGRSLRFPLDGNMSATTRSTSSATQTI